MAGGWKTGGLSARWQPLGQHKPHELVQLAWLGRPCQTASLRWPRPGPLDTFVCSWGCFRWECAALSAAQWLGRRRTFWTATTLILQRRCLWCVCVLERDMCFPVLPRQNLCACARAGRPLHSW